HSNYHSVYSVAISNIFQVLANMDEKAEVNEAASSRAKTKRGSRGKRFKTVDVRIGCYNMNGGRNPSKWKEIELAMQENDLTIMGLTETHLVDDESAPPIEGYKWYYTNRLEGEGKFGGVGLYVKNNVEVSNTLPEQTTLGKDLVWVHCRLLGRNVSIGLVYFAPKNATVE